MEIVFWGTRGSYPVPGKSTVEYGGNTACHTVMAGGRVLVFDAGTGIINFGRKLIAEGGDHNIALFISHSHIDHIAGILYFPPNYISSTKLHIFGPADGRGGIKGALDEITLPPAHPVSLDAMGMRYACTGIADRDRICWAADGDEPVRLAPGETPAPGDVVVKVMLSHRHPVDSVLVFRVEYAGKSYVYASDVEGDAESGDPELAAFAAGADLMAHDGQYRLDDYRAKRRGWGHSTPEMAVRTAVMAGVKRLAVIHYEPTYDDETLAAMERETKALFPDSFFPKEGQRIVL